MPDDARGWQVAIADPRQPLDNAPGIARVQLRSQAIAASGHGSRGYTIGRRHLSHIIDPLDGWPLSYAPSAAVVAADAATADRSEERSAGQECASTCRKRWSPYHLKQ